MLVSVCSTYLEARLGLVHVPPAQDPHLVVRLVIGQLSWQGVHTYGLEKKKNIQVGHHHYKLTQWSLLGFVYVAIMPR